MDSNELAGELVKLAKELVAGQAKLLDDRTRSGSGGDLYKSMRSLVKSNQGLWRSEKQGQFILNKIKRGGSNPSSFDFNNKLRDPSDDYLGIVITDMHFQKGYANTYLTYVYHVDRHGVLLEQKAKHGSNGMSFKVTFKRQAGIVPEVDEDFENEQSDLWFRKNRKNVNFIIEHLSDNKFWNDAIEDLNDRIVPSDRMFDKLIEQAEEAKKRGESDSFPDGDVTTTIEVKVRNVKTYDGAYGVSYGIGGVDKNYSEYCFIMVSGDWLSNANEDPDSLKGKTLKIKGKFVSDGNIIKKVKRTRLKLVD